MKVERYEGRKKIIRIDRFALKGVIEESMKSK
jgi:hypothetical protein